MKLLILILGAKKEPFNSVIKNGIFQTWGSLKHENIKIITYYGDHDKEELIDNNLYLKSNDTNAHYKTMDAFEWCLKNLEFDYILRTNVSTFIRIEHIYDHLLNCTSKNYYAGRINTLYGIKNLYGYYDYTSVQKSSEQFILKYPSGTMMLFSKDIIEFLVKNKSLIKDNGYGDDTSIGEFLYLNGFNITEDIPRFDVNDWNLNTLYNTSKVLLNKYWFFRCKTERDGPRILADNEFSLCPKYRNDIPKMEYLFNLFYNHV